jgi:hypothetical protein
LTHRLTLPKRLDLNAALIFSNDLDTLWPQNHYVFDFSFMDWVEPFALLFISSKIKKLRHDMPRARFSAKGHDNNSYAAHMGFFRLFGLPFGKEPGEARGNESYLPITVLKAEDLRRKAAESHSAVGSVIEKRSRSLAQVLARQDDGDLVDILSYSFTEILRNVIEHSKSDVLEYCAQYWPMKDCVEICILDTGVGIRKTLSGNPHLTINSDQQALSLCLLPGISGKAYRGKKRRSDSHWENSGYGLYMTSRLCGEGGSFFIASGGAGLLLDGFGTTRFELDFTGTVLRLSLKTDKLSSLRKALTRYLKEGQELAGNLGGRANTTASGASWTFSRSR